MGTKLPVLFFDIETAPLLAHIWRPNDEYIPHDRLVHDFFMLTWSAKLHGERKITSGVLTSGEAKKQDDTRIVTALADMIREADTIVAHNIKGFDLPMLNSRVILLGLKPLGPTRVIDTYLLMRNSARMAYNKLDYLGEALGLGRKIKTDFSWWEDCYHGDTKALKKMLKYNRQDVVLLEKVFDRIVPYMTGLPRLFSATKKGERICLFCGSIRLESKGLHHMPSGPDYRRLRCVDCGRGSREALSIPESRPGVRPV